MGGQESLQRTHPAEEGTEIHPFGEPEEAGGYEGMSVWG